MRSEGDYTSRLSEEERFHDRMIEEGDTRGGYFYRWGLSAEAIKYARELLGDVGHSHKQVLDFGCGTGDETIRLAQLGAQVTAIDISMRMVETTAERANLLGLGDKVKAVKMSGEELVFDEGIFDFVYGVSVIHHLVLDVAAPQIRRVLKPGGKAVFVEPLVYSPMINLFRRLTPKRRSVTEAPLTTQQIHSLAAGYRSLRTREFGLCTLAAVAFPWKPLFRIVLKIGTICDHVLLGVIPQLRRYCWITVIELVK